MQAGDPKMDELESLRRDADAAAIDRLLDALLPTPTQPNPDPDPLREKLRSHLVGGRLDERKLEFEFTTEVSSHDNSDAAFEQTMQRFAERTPGAAALLTDAEVLQFLLDAISRQLPLLAAEPRKRQIVTVREARELFAHEEYERLRTIRPVIDYQITLEIPQADIVSVDSELLAALRRNPSLIYNITHRQFEEFLRDFLLDLGYEVTLTAQTRDGGCDLIGFTTDRLGIKTKYVIEAKHYLGINKVGVGAVRQLSAVRQKFGAHHGLLVTTSYFTADAVTENTSYYGLNLRDYDNIAEWLRS